MWGSRWHGVSILSRSGDISTSGLAAAILNYRHPLTSGSIRNSTIDVLDPENMVIAVGISLLCILEAEIRLM